MKKNILQLLEKTKSKFPNNIAFSDDNGEMTYEQVVHDAQAIGSKLSGMGTNRGIMVLLDKSKEMLVSFMGTVYSGNFYIPIDTEMPNDRLQVIFNVVKPIAIITDSKNWIKASSVSEQINILQYSELIQSEIDYVSLEKIRSHAIDTDPVYALFTSGSTGVPKGVICCHRSIINYADWLIDIFDFNENTIFGSQAPFYFSMSVLDIFATIKSGARLHIIPKQLFAFPVKLLEYLNEQKINSIYWVPTALCNVANLKALEKVKLPYLKKILFAGESMPSKQLNIWRNYVPDAMYANLFGPTEITDIGIYYIVNRVFKDDEKIPIGKTCDNVDILILNENDESVEKGDIGELCIRGSFLALGYYDDFQTTETVFVQNPLNNHYPEIIYKSGDLVSENEYGELIYHGRKDFQIKHRGNRIELGEIENAAYALNEIARCCCLYDEVRSKIVLFIEQDLSISYIKDRLKPLLPEYMLPNRIIYVENIPINANGKIDRTALKKLL